MTHIFKVTKKNISKSLSKPKLLVNGIQNYSVLTIFFDGREKAKQSEAKGGKAIYLPPATTSVTPSYSQVKQFNLKVI